MFLRRQSLEIGPSTCSGLAAPALQWQLILAWLSVNRMVTSISRRRRHIPNRAGEPTQHVLLLAYVRFVPFVEWFNCRDGRVELRVRADLRTFGNRTSQQQLRLFVHRPLFRIEKSDLSEFLPGTLSVADRIEKSDLSDFGRAWLRRDGLRPVPSALVWVARNAESAQGSTDPPGAARSDLRNRRVGSSRASATIKRGTFPYIAGCPRSAGGEIFSARVLRRGGWRQSKCGLNLGVVSQSCGKSGLRC